MLGGWRFADIGGTNMPLNKKYGRINVLIVPTNYRTINPDSEPFTEILISNSTNYVKLIKQGPRAQYGNNAAGIEEIVNCLSWIDSTVVSYKEEVGLVQSYLGRIKYYKYKKEEKSRKKKFNRYLETHKAQKG